MPSKTRRRCQTPWNWSCKQLLATHLETKLRSPAGVVVLVTTDGLLLTTGFFALGWSALQAAVSPCVSVLQGPPQSLLLVALVWFFFACEHGDTLGICVIQVPLCFPSSQLITHTISGQIDPLYTHLKGTDWSVNLFVFVLANTSFIWTDGRAFLFSINSLYLLLDSCVNTKLYL